MHPSIVVKAPIAHRRPLYVPRPTPQHYTLFLNVNRDSTLFLEEAGIEKDSDQHKALKKTIQSLHRVYMHPFKYVEEQEPQANQVIAKARNRLPWLGKYEDSWPARIYLKRYVDGRRPHLQCSRHALSKRGERQKPFGEQATKGFLDCDPPMLDSNQALRGFLCSLTPSLEHHFDGFARLGIRDEATIQAFLSWPQVTQSQFLDENHGQLQLTSLEKKSLLVGCGLLAQRALQKSYQIVEPFQS